jgi:hypothetical protein
MLRLSCTNDFRRVGEVVIGQILERMSVINGRSVLGHLIGRLRHKPMSAAANKPAR